MLFGYRNAHFTLGLACSCILHAALAYVSFYLAAGGPEKSQAVIYSVTLESGKERGGITQAPKTEKVEKAPPKNVSAKEKEKPRERPAEEKKPETKQPEEKQEKEKAEVSLKEKQEPKKTEPVKKVDPKQTPAKKTEPPKPAPTKTPAPDVNKQYQAAMQRYLGESANAGGRGWGSTGMGGRGMGGGQVRSAAWLNYYRSLEEYIKRGWNWHDKSTVFIAFVEFKISPSGELGEVRLAESSGNSKYDESVLRAVLKASPVPPAPPELYEEFRFVSIEFVPD